MIIKLLLLAAATSFAAAPAAPGAAITKPFKEAIAGAECFTSPAPKYKGLVAFGFPSRAARGLAFTLGPLTDGLSPGQEKNKPYQGPGKYAHVGISGKSKDGKRSFAGFGTIVVNADGRSGTFSVDGGKAAGSWDCGKTIPR